MGYTRVSQLERMTANEIEDDDLILIADMRSCLPNAVFAESSGPVSKCIRVGDLKAYFIRELGRATMDFSQQSEWNRLLHELKDFGERLSNEQGNRNRRVR